MLLQVHEIRQQELSKLLSSAQARKHQEGLQLEVDQLKRRENHFKDMATLKEKQARMNHIMEESLHQKKMQDASEEAEKRESINASKRAENSRRDQVKRR